MNLGTKCNHYTMQLYRHVIYEINNIRISCRPTKIGGQPVGDAKAQ
jgi:hypothetical protein